MVDTADHVGTHADPARDVRDDIMDVGGVPEMLDKIWFHKTASAVIDADRCVGCGACIAACPSKSIGIGSDGLPTLVRMHRLLGLLGLLPDGRLPSGEAEQPEPRGPGRPCPGGGLGPRASPGPTAPRTAAP
jgi:ferredoxin